MQHPNARALRRFAAIAAAFLTLALVWPAALAPGAVAADRAADRSAGGVETRAQEAAAPPTSPDAAAVEEVREELAEGDRTRVIVMTDARQRPEADLGPQQVDAQHAAIAASLDDLDESLAGTDSRLVSTLESVPSAAYSVTEEGLEALLDNPEVVSVVLDGEVRATLGSSTKVIGSGRLNTAGVRGNGFEGGEGRFAIAVVDSGVDSGHKALAGKVVAQGCWVTDKSCPGKVNSTTAKGSGEECTHSTDCDHGTHVAGIAAGSSYSGGHKGVAPGARIVALKVAQDAPGSRWAAQFSSINSALQHALTLRNSTVPRLAAVNLSVGTSEVYAAGDAACDALNPTLVSLMGQLQTAGVAVVVAAGNNWTDDAMSFPGCATGAYAIGATNDADAPASFSNSSADLRWWAPGVSITAPVPTGGSKATKDGTSMAAPHVAGAFALLRECVDDNGAPVTKDDAAGLLDATGADVTRNGVTRKRIDVLDAATSTVSNNDFAGAKPVPAAPGPAGFEDFGANVCSDTEPGEPGPADRDNGVWWRWTPSDTGAATISTDDGARATTFDTALTVYTGDTLPTLKVAAYDDNGGQGKRSRVTFPVSAGTTYHLKVDGAAAQTGLINLRVGPVTPPTCAGEPATIVGTGGDDTITGTGGDDVIVAYGGDDAIHARGGNDLVCAGAGDDVVHGGVGDDAVRGGKGNDIVYGGHGSDSLVGGAGKDRLFGRAGADHLDGGSGRDHCNGGPGKDTQVRCEVLVSIP